MKETFIKNIINGFCKFYDYGVIELNSIQGLSTAWALVRNIDISSKKVIIFLDYTKEFNQETLFTNLRDILNCNKLQLVKINIVKKDEIFQDKNEFMYEEDAITFDYTSNKLLAYGYECEETAQELVNLINYYDSKRNEEKNNKSKPWVTYTLICINVIMYAITAFLSGSIIDSDINVLVLLGAKVNELIATGEYYRLITSMFLHGGLLHLVLNMYALNSIGPLIEKIYGRSKYIFIYFISGIASSLLSYILSDSVSIGASGAIFGLLGTTLVFAVTMRKNAGKDFLKNIASVIIINLFIGFTMSNIDNFGHIGGLLGGAITAIILNLSIKKRKG